MRHINATGIATASSFEGHGIIPVGGIIMWHGADNAVPANWRLCNGQFGTPDLRNQFVVGRGGLYGAGQQLVKQLQR